MNHALRPDDSDASSRVAVCRRSEDGHLQRKKIREVGLGLRYLVKYPEEDRDIGIPVRSQ